MDWNGNCARCCDAEGVGDTDSPDWEFSPFWRYLNDEEETLTKVTISIEKKKVYMRHVRQFADLFCYLVECVDISCPSKQALIENNCQDNPQTSRSFREVIPQNLVTSSLDNFENHGAAMASEPIGAKQVPATGFNMHSFQKWFLLIHWLQE